ncbi:hypothetical protein VZC37_17280 [Gordonia sp. LSe1-13]|uniref:DUF8017 domain-containing protein n=1 Tax=Gordonia sesuvii TaxID=3116777 RepID=A0ABU7MGX0_9ACTN|nr:hypothetical protein [Gordonia sp. LSe1-13]
MSQPTQGGGSDHLPPGWTAVSAGESPDAGGSGKNLAVISVVLLVLVAAIVGVGILTFRQFDANDDSAAGESVGASPTDTDRGTQSPTECPPGVAGPNTPAGWLTVAGQRHLAYDVPPDWRVASCQTLVGWESPCPDGPFGYCPVRTMSGAAFLETSQCPDDWAGISGLPGAKDAPDIDSAIRAESALVESIYTSESGHVPDVALSEPRHFTVSGSPAVHILATVTDIEATDCDGDTALHSMVATTVPDQPGAVLFVISLPQGMPGAAESGVIHQMVSTLRHAR